MNKDLSIFLDQHSFTIEKELFYNERKSQFVGIVKQKNTNKQFIIKHQYPINRLEIEIDFYKKNLQNEYVPKLISYGQNCLVLEYYNSKTFLEFLENERNEETIKLVLDQLNSYINDNYDLTKIYIDADVKKQIIKIFNKLLTSGVKDKNRFYLFELFFAIGAYTLSPFLRLIIPDISKKGPYKQTVHGDLHLNNILVLENKKIKIIDWENTFKSSPLIDVLYITPMIEKKIGANYLEKYDFYHCLPYVVKKAMLFFIRMNSKF